MMTKSQLKRWILFVFAIYAICILLLNILPLSLSEEINEMYIWEFRADYITHGLIFLPWSLFQFLFFKKEKIAWFITGAIFSFAIEFVQYFLPYRSFNVFDMLFNFTGLVMGYLIFAGLNLKLDDYFLQSSHSHKKRRKHR